MHRVILAGFLSLAAPAALAAPTDATAVLNTLERCLARLDAREDVGFKRIAARCPRLARQLVKGEWSAWLPEQWNAPENELSPASLRELHMLLARESQVIPIGPAPRVQELQAVLAQLGHDIDEEAGLWGRFKSWLRRILTTQEENAGQDAFARFMQRAGLTQSIIELITFSALALIVVLAGVILVNELRVAGVWRRRGRSRSIRVEPLSTQRARLRWRDVELAPHAEKLRVLLELVVQSLTGQQRLPPASGLTTRQLLLSAQLPQEAERKRLATLALAAEEARYGATLPDTERLDAALESGHQLLQRIQGMGR